MSTNGDLGERFSAQVRVLQIIVAALALGPLIYLGVARSTVPQGKQGPPGKQAPPREQAAGVGDVSFTHLACGMAAAAVAAWLIVPPLVVLRFRRQIAVGAWPPPGQTGGSPSAPLSDAEKLCALYTIRTIIAVAILEGTTFFLVFAYQQQRDSLTLGLAVALILAILAHLPTRGRVAEWIRRQLERLGEDRQVQQFHR